MNIHDYLIDQSGKDWSDLLSPWNWMLPKTFTVWIVNRFGDVFMVLDDDSVHMLDIGSGLLSRIASNRDEFADLMDQDGNADDWLMIPLVDELVASGLFLSEDQCYSYRVAPVLGGSYSLDNFEVTDLSVHYAIFGQINEQIKDIPDGTSIEFSIEE